MSPPTQVTKSNTPHLTHALTTDTVSLSFGSDGKNLKRKRSESPADIKNENPAGIERPTKREKIESPDSRGIKQEPEIKQEAGLKQEVIPEEAKYSSLTSAETETLVRAFFRKWSFFPRALTPAEEATKAGEFDQVREGVRSDMQRVPNQTAVLDIKPYYQGLAQEELDSKGFGKRQTDKRAARFEKIDLFKTI